VRLRVNQRVELWVADRAYAVRVEDVAPTEVTLSAPLEGARPVLPPSGTPVRARVYADDGAWEFRGTVTRSVPGPVEAVYVRVDAGPVPVERRTGARRRLSLQVAVRRLDRWPVRPVGALLADLSEGGGRLELENPWPEPAVGERVLVVGPRSLNLWGRVVWVRPRFERARQFTVGVAWSEDSRPTARRWLGS
jgi:hypothetical protein